MGITWSAYKKVKDNTLLLCTAELTKTNKEEIFFVYNMGKVNPKIKSAYGTDGFALGKDPWTKNWILKWWYKIDDATFDEDEDTELPNWEATRKKLVDKWIIKIADAQAVLEAQSESSSEDVEESPPPRRKKAGVKTVKKTESKTEKTKKTSKVEKKKPVKAAKKKATPPPELDSADDDDDYQDLLDDDSE